MTTTPVQMGQPGVVMVPGDHICAFYRGPGQRDDVLLPFLREGIRSGDKCLCVLDDPDPERVILPLSLTVDVETSRSSGQFELLASDAAYLPDATFRPDQMLAFWDRNVGAAVQHGGYGFVRSVGEMTWALRDLPGVDQLVGYEAELNRFLPRYPQVILCLYDLERFTDGRMLMELLRTHPKVLMSGQLLENPWYLAPDAGAIT